jgi:hypothetical protein
MRAEALNESSVWKVVLCRPDCEPKVAIDKALCLKIYEIWSALVENERIMSYVYQLDKDKLFELVATIDNYSLWLDIIKKETIDPKTELLYLKGNEWTDLWVIVLSKNYIKKYLGSLTSDELILLGEEIGSKKFWSRILKIPSIRPDSAFFHLKEVEDHFIWQIVLKRKDVISWLDRLMPDVLIEIGKKINNWQIWKMLIERITIVEYINKLPAKDLINLTTEADSYHLSDLIINLPHFAFTDAFDLARKSKDGCAWRTATMKLDFIEHINTLTCDELVAFAQLYNNEHVWKVVLKMKAITVDKAVLHAKSLNKESVWKALESRDDFQLFLKLKK